MESQPMSSAAEELMRLNQQFGDWERDGLHERARTAFSDHLDANLVFRRGDGTTVNRKEFLDGLASHDNTSEHLEVDIVQIQILGDQAVVVVRVYLKGVRRGNSTEGHFSNIRLFERRSNVWRCVMWFNKKL